MQAAFGTWQSPITSDLIVCESIGLSGPQCHEGAFYWIESRPQEGGRNVIVQRLASGHTRDITPAGFNVRNRVHEYGGGAWWLHQQQIYFCNFSDQQIYTQTLNANANDNRPSEPVALTHAANLRFADGLVDSRRNRLIVIVEAHHADGTEAQNYLGAVDLATGQVSCLHAGHDFYAAPVLSGDGEKLAWITWDHPDMPWDGTELWQARIGADGTLTSEKLAGSRTEAIQQPRYDGHARLYFISDRSGWWNLYRWEADAKSTPLWPLDAEFGVPLWSFGASSYQFAGEQILCCYAKDCQSYLALLSADGSHSIVKQPCTEISGIRVDQSTGLCLFTGASSATSTAIYSVDLTTREHKVIKASDHLSIDPDYFSVPRAVTFPTAQGDLAHGFYYPPTNKDYQAPPGATPPLLVELHGGPTAATGPGFSLSTQFWTSRGFAVLDINYRGSTGYGRAYRDKLKRQWGVVDVDDTVFGARYLADQKLADPDRLIIKGGSAGGYTTLAALALRDTFKAGACYYGIGDLETLARDCHKFESRYLDSLIGAYPKEMAIYKARSPIHHIDKLSCPVIFFQGLEDKVVPPNQAEDMVAALNSKGIPVAYVPFEGEQHGFRKAENIKRALDLELYFYGQVLGFAPADLIEPITILNLAR